MADEQTTKDDNAGSTVGASAPRDERSAMIGKKLGDYELVELMAAGGMARIFKGIDRRLERTAAVKVLMRELMESDDTLTDRFSREAKAIARLEHENIVRIYQTGEQDGYYFLAMKYVEGKDLADELNDLRRRGRNMEVKRTLRILGQVAAALDYAHRHDIIHRDIKPSNILLDKEDKAVLTDFGLALWQSKDKTMGTAFGTPRYISPEQALASERSVPQSDIYSLAVVLYEILTGDMLFRADTPMQIALSHISEPPPAPRSVNPNIPEGVERELLKALAKDPNKRHRTATEFINSITTAYGPALSQKDGPLPAPLSISKTPVLTDDSKQDLLAAWDNKVKSATGSSSDSSSTSAPVNAAAPSDMLNTQTAHVRPPELAKAAKQGRGIIRPLTIAVLLLALVGGGAFFAMNGGLGSNSGGTPAATQAGISGQTSTDAPTTAPTPIPANAADSPLLLSYNWFASVFLNRTEARYTADDLEVTWEGGQQDVNAVDLSQNGCAVIYLNSRDFNAGDFACTGNQKPIQVPQEKLFWRNTVTQSFEVRYKGQVIGRCAVVERGDPITECPLDWPRE